MRWCLIEQNIFRVNWKPGFSQIVDIRVWGESSPRNWFWPKKLQKEIRTGFWKMTVQTELPNSSEVTINSRAVEHFNFLGASSFDFSLIQILLFAVSHGFFLQSTCYFNFITRNGIGHKGAKWSGMVSNESNITGRPPIDRVSRVYADASFLWSNITSRMREWYK